MRRAKRGRRGKNRGEEGGEGEGGLDRFYYMYSRTPDTGCSE